MKAAILSGTYGLDSLLRFNLKLLDVNPTNQAQVSWRAYHGPAPVGLRDTFLISSEQSLSQAPITLLATPGRVIQSPSQEIIFQAQGLVNRPQETPSSAGSFARRKTPPSAPAPSPSHSGSKMLKVDTCTGFSIAWTSFDDICENIMELRHTVERSIPGHPIQLSDYTRVTVRVGGWLCEQNPSGGCDVSLYVDSSIWDDLSHWMTNVLAQTIMLETMDDLRANIATLNPTTGTGRSRHASLCVTDSMYGGIRQQMKRITADATQALEVHGEIFNYTQRGVDDSDNFFAMKSEIASQSDNRSLNLPSMLPHSDLDPVVTVNSPVRNADRPLSARGAADPFMTPRSNRTGSVRTPGSGTPTTTPLRAVKLYIRSLGYTDFSTDSINILFQYTGHMERSASGEPIVRPPSTLVWQVRARRDDMTLYSTMLPSSTWQLIKCSCYMNFEAGVIQRLVTDDSRLHLIDNMFDHHTYIRAMDPFTNIRRMCFKGIWPTSPRDFVVATTTYPMPDGSVLIATRSVPGEFDEQPGYVRARLHISGFLIVPCALLPDDPVAQTIPNGCMVSLAVHIDLGGSLPSGLLNMLTMNAPLRLFTRIKEVLAQDQKDAEKSTASSSDKKSS